MCVGGVPCVRVCARARACVCERVCVCVCAHTPPTPPRRAHTLAARRRARVHRRCPHIVVAVHGWRCAVRVVLMVAGGGRRRRWLGAGVVGGRVGGGAGC